MQPRVFDVINLEKARVRGSGKTSYIATYEVTTRAGTKYTQYFYRGQEQRIPKFLANVNKRGGTAVRIDRAPSPHVVVEAPPVVPLVLEQKPTGPGVQVTTAEVADRQMQHANDVRYDYQRLGDKVKQLDPAGYKQALYLHETSGQLDKLRERSASVKDSISRLLAADPKASVNQLYTERTNIDEQIAALSEARSKVMSGFLARPLSWKLSRVVAVEGEIAALRKEGDEWIAANPEKWKVYLKKHAARERKLLKEGKRASPAMKYPAHIEEKLHRLSWKLKGVKGPTHVVAVHAPKLGVGEQLKVISSEATNGLTPEDGAVSYALSTGAWKNVAPNGTNAFTRGESAALHKEFGTIINNIVAGRSFKPGWAKVFDLKDLAQDLTSHLNVKLFELAATYSPSKAAEQEAAGNHFKKYAVVSLNSEAQHFVRARLKEAIRKKKMPVEALNEPALTFANDEAPLVATQLRGLDTPVTSGFLAPDDVVALHDLSRIITTKVGKLEAVGLLSRLNLHNPVDGGGLKPWEQVADDVGEYARHLKGPEGAPSHAYLVAHLKRQLGRMFSGKAAGTLGSPSPMTLSEKVGLKEGLTVLHRVIDKRQASLPSETAWRVVKPPTPKGHGRHAKPGVTVETKRNSDVHTRVVGRAAELLFKPVEGHMASRPLLVVKPDVQSFWKQQSRVALKHADTTNHAPHFDPARELDLGMDVMGVTGVTVPLHVKLKQLRAKHYAKVWAKLAKMGSWRLAALSSTPAFKEFEREYTAAQARAASALEEGVEQKELNPAYKPPRVGSGATLTVKLKNRTVTIDGVPPSDVVKMAELIRRQREMDIGVKRLVVNKSEEVDTLLPVLFLKTRRLLKVA